MSYNIKTIFKIKRENFNKKLIEKLLKIVYKNNHYIISDNSLMEKADIAFNNGIGGFSNIFFQTKDHNAPYDLSISIISKERYPNIELDEGLIVIEFIAPRYFFVDEEIKKVKQFIKDIESIYRIIKSDYAIGDIDFNLEPFEFRAETHIGWFNFFSNKTVKAIGKDKFYSINSFKICELEDGSIFLQLTKNVMDASNDLKNEIKLKLFEK